MDLMAIVLGMDREAVVEEMEEVTVVVEEMVEVEVMDVVEELEELGV